MKKVLVVILTVCILVSVCVAATACEKNPYAKQTEFNVGIIQFVTHPALDAATQGFMDALKAEMEAAGKTVNFDVQNAANDAATCTVIANAMVNKNVDLIMANATPALQAAANTTAKIPVLGTSITEYGVALGLKNFNGTVGSNISGTSDLADLAKQADMFTELLPNADKIALLYCSAEPNSKYQVDVVKAALEKKGKTADLKSFSDSNDISAVLSGIVSGGYKAVYIPTDNTCASNTGIIDATLRPARIPVIAGEEGICQTAGIATLSISYYGIGVKTGKMAADIFLKGEKISKMAIAYDESPVYKYNAAICAELGITVPSNYIAIEA